MLHGEPELFIGGGEPEALITGASKTQNREGFPGDGIPWSGPCLLGPNDPNMPKGEDGDEIEE